MRDVRKDKAEKQKTEYTNPPVLEVGQYALVYGIPVFFLSVL